MPRGTLQSANAGQPGGTPAQGDSQRSQANSGNTAGNSQQGGQANLQQGKQEK